MPLPGELTKLEYAGHLCRAIERAFPAYLVGVYGSVLTQGEFARDIDILMVPKRETAIPDAQLIAAAIGGTVLAQLEHGISASSCLVHMERFGNTPVILDIRIDRWVRPTGHPGFDCPVPMEAEG